MLRLSLQHGNTTIIVSPRQTNWML